MRRETIYMSNNGGLNLGNGCKNEENWGEVLEVVLTDQGMNWTWGMRKGRIC